MSRMDRTPTILLAALIAAGFAGCGEDTVAPPDGPYAMIQTYAGNGIQGNGDDGLPPEETALYWPQDLAFGPDGRVYILDWNNHRVRIVENGVTRTLCGTGYLGDAPSGPATEIALNHPTHVNFDASGNVIVSAWHNSKVLHIDMSTNWASPIAGTGARSFSGDGGPAVEAALDLPVATLFDDDGRLLIMDQANQCIRRVENGLIETFAGTAKQPGFAGDGGPVGLAKFNFPTGQSAPPSGRMAIDSAGKIYIADTGNNRIRVLEPEALPGAPGFAHDEYIVNTIAGTGERGFSGEGVPALEAKLELPSDVDVDSQGNVYIVDTYNHCVRKVDLNGIITTFAGRPNVTWSGEYNPDAKVGDGGWATQATLNRPYGIAIDSEDNVYIADTHNNRIRVVWKDPDAHR